MKNHSPPSVEPLQLVFSRSLGVEVLRRGIDNGALLQFVPLQESEKESGDMPGLLALISACTSTNAYSAVSGRDFLIQNQSLDRKLSSLPYIS